MTYPGSTPATVSFVPRTTQRFGGGLVLLFGWWFQICFYVHSENWGRWTQFDEYFSNGWFNHQPVVFVVFLVGKKRSKTHTKTAETSSEFFSPENGWLEYDSFPFGAFQPIFRGEPLVSGRGIPKMGWWTIPISPDQWISFSKLSSWPNKISGYLLVFFLFGSSKIVEEWPGGAAVISHQKGSGNLNQSGWLLAQFLKVIIQNGWWRRCFKNESYPNIGPCDSGFSTRLVFWISFTHKWLEIPLILRVAFFIVLPYRFIWRYLHPPLMGVGVPFSANQGLNTISWRVLVGVDIEDLFFFNHFFCHLILFGFEKSVCLLTFVQEFGREEHFKHNKFLPKIGITKIENHDQFILCTVDRSEIPNNHLGWC